MRGCKNRGSSRLLAGVLCLLGCSSVGLAQASDNCADAPNLNTNGVYPFTGVGATNDGPGACGFSQFGVDVWYKYTAPAAGHVVFDTCGSGFDSVLNVFDGCGGSLLACNDDAASNDPICIDGNSAVGIEVQAGQEVYVKISAFGGANFGAGQLRLTLGPPATSCTTRPPGAVDEGELCGESLNGGCQIAGRPFFDLPAVPFDVSVFGSTWNFNGDRDEDWYRFDSTGGVGAVQVTVTLRGDVPKLFVILRDITVCQRRSPTPAVADAIARVPCSDVATFTAIVRDGKWAVEVTTPQGDLRYPCGQATGNNYVLTVSTTPIALPPGDVCVTALPAVLGSNAFNTAGFSPDGDHFIVRADYSPSVWYTYTATRTGITAIEACGVPHCAVGVVSECFADPMTSDGCAVTFATQTGMTYRIRLSSTVDGEAIAGTFNITELPPPPNDNCSGAIAVDVGDNPFDLMTATTEGPPASGGIILYGNGESKDLWYSFTAPRTGVLSATTCDSPGKIVAIYQSCGGAELASGVYTGPLDPCPEQQVGNARLPVTAGQTMLVRVSAGADIPGLSAGTLHLEIQDPPAPCVAFPPDALMEGEDCGADTNGTPDLAMNLVFGQPAGEITIAGTTMADNLVRDTDMYRFATTEPSTRIDLSVQSDVPIDASLVLLSSGLADPSFALTSASVTERCSEGSSGHAIVGPGTYVIVATPSARADFPCESVNNYLLTVRSTLVGACCGPSGCSLVSQAECATSGGFYQGDGSSCGNYIATESLSAVEDISSTGTEGPTNYNATVLANLGFEFEFYGNTYSDVSICTNGFLQFQGGSFSDFNIPIPSAEAPLNAIFGLWDGLWPAPGGHGHLYYQTLGTAPERRFVVQWADMGHLQVSSYRFNFEIVLFEGTNTIELRYGDIPPDAAGGTPTADYTIGVQNLSATASTSINTASIGVGHTARVLSFSPACTNMCRLDFNHDGFIDPDDLSDFISCYFTQPCSGADYNGDGFTDPDDLADYIAVYFTGC